MEFSNRKYSGLILLAKTLLYTGQDDASQHPASVLCHNMHIAREIVVVLTVENKLVPDNTAYD